MKDIFLSNKKRIIIASILLLLIIIMTIIININKKGNSILINTYISRLENKDNYLNITECNIDDVLKYNNIPYLNINKPLYNDINEEILTNFLLRSCYQDGYIDYEASINDDILSLAINISYETDDDLAYVEYKTYNINTKTDNIIDNQSILKKYNLSLNSAKTKVLNHLKKYYDYEKTKGYITTQSFSDYLNILEYEPITLDNMKLFIDKHNDLYIIKDYTISEGMSIDEEFPFITTKFKLN